MGPVGRGLLWFNTTLLGRLTCGPFLTLVTVYGSEARRFTRGDRRDLGAWLLHLAGAALVAAWLVACGVPLWLYGLACVVPSIALTRLRAYAEHRWADAPEHRTAVVEGSRVFGLLFLFNNLHAVHHRWPTVPWYALAAALPAGAGAGPGAQRRPALPRLPRRLPPLPAQPARRAGPPPARAGSGERGIAGLGGRPLELEDARVGRERQDLEALERQRGARLGEVRVGGRRVER